MSVQYVIYNFCEEIPGRIDGCCREHDRNFINLQDQVHSQGYYTSSEWIRLRSTWCKIWQAYSFSGRASAAQGRNLTFFDYLDVQNK